jgi:hypothetical protein
MRCRIGPMSAWHVFRRTYCGRKCWMIASLAPPEHGRCRSSDSHRVDERIARLRTHEQNISHNQNMLKTRLSEVELHFVEKRLTEERFAMRMTTGTKRLQAA